MDDTERKLNRATVNDVLSGVVTEETHPVQWQEDVYMFAIRAGWGSDSDWMGAQLGNTAYPFAKRAYVAGLCPGSERVRAFEELARHSTRFSEPEDARSDLLAFLQRGVSLGQLDQEAWDAMTEVVVVLEMVDPEWLSYTLLDKRYARIGRRTAAAFVVSETGRVIRGALKDEA